MVGHPVSVISSISGPILDLKVPRVQGVRLLDSVLVSNLAPFQRCGVTTELVRYPTMQLFSISYIGINIQYSKSSLDSDQIYHYIDSVSCMKLL